MDGKTILVLAHGTLLGSNMQQTLMNGPMGLRVLSRALFSVLQRNIFPPYFAGHAILSLATILTAPGSGKGAETLLSVTPVLFHGVLSVVDLVFVGPSTIGLLKRRTHQGRDVRASIEYVESTDADLQK